MKISALKNMISAAVRAELKQMEKRLEESFKQKLAEALNGSAAPLLTEGSTQSESDLSELRTHFRTKQTRHENTVYSDIDSLTKSKLVPTASKPKNKRGVTKDGKLFASGENILEWFQAEKGEQALNEHKQALKKMEKTDEYINRITGKK